MSPTVEHLRLAATATGTADWQRWGTYVSDRAWGTVREDYSADGNAATTATSRRWRGCGRRWAPRSARPTPWQSRPRCWAWCSSGSVAAARAWEGGPSSRSRSGRACRRRALNEALHRVFAEPDVYRIDHYLGKNAVQNILFFRSGNTFVEPIWNRQYGVDPVIGAGTPAYPLRTRHVGAGRSRRRDAAGRLVRSVGGPRRPGDRRAGGTAEGIMTTRSACSRRHSIACWPRQRCLSAAHGGPP